MLLFHIWKAGKCSSTNTAQLKVLEHQVWVQSGVISSLLSTTYHLLGPTGYSAPFSKHTLFLLRSTSNGVMSVLPCFVQRRRWQAGQTQTPHAGLTRSIWMLEEALGHLEAHILSQTPSAHLHPQTHISKAAQEL